MKKKIADLTLREVIKLKCIRECKECPFCGNHYLEDNICDLVNTKDENNLLEQEIEVEE